MKFKVKKVLFSLFIMFLSTLVVYAEAPNEITINGGNLRYISAASYLTNVDTTDGVNDGQNLSYKVTTDGTVTYCISPDKFLYDGTITYSKGDRLNNKIAYVLENGYPNKSITGDNDKDYFITNLAVWYLMEPTADKLANYNFPAGTYKGQSMDVVSRAYSLASAANNYTPQTGSINVGNSNITMTVDGNYYVTPGINVNITGNAGTYTVTLNGAPSGTKTTDASGTEKTTFTKGNGFIIKVPVNSVSSASITFRATISANFTDSEAYAYNPNSYTAHQSVGLVTSTSSPKTASITLNISGSTNVVISKQDITNHSELAGARLVLKDSSGTIIDSWTSGTTPHTVEGLEAGRYTLTETLAPTGYVLDTTASVTFTINSAGSISNLIGGKIVMYNEPEPVTGKVTISKRDATTGDELPGAKLVVKNSSGSIIDSWTSTTTPHVINDLEPGRYTLSETLAPDGYYLNTETITFTIGEDGKVVGGTVVMENTPKPVVGKIIISKRDATTNKGLAGAVLVLKNASGTEIKRWTTTKNTYTIDNLAPGKYTITEVSAPKGYVLNKEPVTFRVNDDGTVSEGTIIFKNHPEDNPQTGSSLSIVFIIVGLLSLGYATYIILRKGNNKA